MAADPDQPTLSFDPPASGGSNASAAVRQESSSVEADVAVDQHVVRVRPDEPAIDRTFDYLVPSSMSEQIRVGTMVRIRCAVTYGISSLGRSWPAAFAGSNAASATSDF